MADPRPVSMRRNKCMTGLIEPPRNPDFRTVMVRADNGDVVATFYNNAAHNPPTDAFKNTMGFYHAFQADRADDQRSQHEQG